jgi:pyridoxal phosphate enzyme (YggS family)
VKQVREVERSEGRAAGSVHLLAISKKHSLDQIEELYRAGQRDFGENYVQELVAKAQGAQARGLDEIRWHFVGHLQSNKIKAVLPWVDRIHSVDSASLAQQLAKRWRELGRTTRLKVLIEVNLSSEETKTGITEATLPDLVHSIVEEKDALELSGLMCIPAADLGEAERAFAKLASMAAQLGIENCELSMGMTSDYGLAIRHGSTWVRVGTAIFGPRPTAAP